MYLELKENRPHGTKDYPYTQYFMHNPKQAFHIPVHWHNEIEIIYLKKGKLRISIEEEIYDASPGEVYFVNPKELHFMDSEDMSVEYYTILFPLEFISFQTEDLLETEVLKPLRSGKLLLHRSVKAKSCLEEVEKYLQEMIAVNTEKYMHYQLRTRILLLHIIEALMRGECLEYASFRSSSDLQREMISYIQKKYAEKITLQMLAKEFHLSEKYVSRYFKEHFAISFMQYVGHLRMTKAKALLDSSDLSITEVALSCGYPSVNLFIRNFKSAYQMTPLQYRKKEK